MVLTFPAPGLPGIMLKATLNAKNLIDRVETHVDNPVLGDTLYEATYTDYRDVDPERASGVLVPHRILQKQGGYPVLDLTVTGGRMGYAYIVFPIPENVEKAAAESARVRVDAQKVADLTGGTHHSVAVEFKDYMTLIEGPQDDERAIAVIDAVVVERWTKLQGSELNLYYVLSTWDPYLVVLMKSRLHVEP